MYNDSKKTDFQTISPNLQLIIQELVANDDLCKMLYYMNKEPLKEEINSDIKEKIFSEDYVTDVPLVHASKIEKSAIVISFDNFIAGMANPQYMSSTIIFDIVCPVTAWKIKDRTNKTALRVYELAHIIHKIMNGKKLNGIGRCTFSSASQVILPANSVVAGLTLRYNIYESDNGGFALRGRDNVAL